MYSSYANFDKTYFYGNSYDFGDFDRCLNIHYKSKTENVDVINGKHCMVQYYPVKNDAIEVPPSKTHCMKVDIKVDSY